MTTKPGFSRGVWRPAAGMRVFHAEFGLGTVLGGAERTGRQDCCLVRFDDLQPVMAGAAWDLRAAYPRAGWRVVEGGRAAEPIPTPASAAS